MPLKLKKPLVGMVDEEVIRRAIICIDQKRCFISMQKLKQPAWVFHSVVEMAIPVMEKFAIQFVPAQ
jgi:hypothetical protein